MPSGFLQLLLKSIGRRWSNKKLFHLGAEEVVGEEGAEADDVAGKETKGNDDEGCKQDWKWEQPSGNGC